MTADRRTLAALVTAAVFGLAACGVDKSSSTGGGGKLSALETQAMAELQDSAGDLVREISFNDKPGTRRVLQETQTALDQSREAVKKASPGAEAEIAKELAEVREAVDRQERGAALTAAKELQTHVDEVAGNGAQGGAKTGLVAVLAEMREAARGVAREAEHDDRAGTIRAYQELAKLFAATRKQIKETSEEADVRITRAMAVLGRAAASQSPAAQREAAEGAIEAISEATELVE